MKKILLATTMLVGTASIAAADGHITFSGSAAAGIGRTGLVAAGSAADIAAAQADLAAAQAAFLASPTGATAAAIDDAEAALAALQGSPVSNFATYSSVGLDATFSGSSDNGLTFGATFGLTAGTSYDIDDGFAAEGGAFGMPEIFIEGSFGRVAFSDDNYDMFDDANAGADVDYSGTFGAISVGLRADIDNSEFSAQADATFAGITVHADADTLGEVNASASYTIGAFTATAGADQNSDYYVTGAYAAGAISAEATYNSDASWDIALDYAANSISAGVTYDSAGDYSLSAGYDLGGGLSLDAGYNNTGAAFVGASMSF